MPFSVYTVKAHVHGSPEPIRIFFVRATIATEQYYCRYTIQLYLLSAIPYVRVTIATEQYYCRYTIQLYLLSAIPNVRVTIATE